MRRFFKVAIVMGVLIAICWSPMVREALAARAFKLATLAPDGSVWDKVLKEMSASWRESSEGRVSLRIYPGGVAGDDPDVVRKMRIGQLHAGSLTLTGLAEIDPYFEALAIPLFFASDEELFYVLRQLEDEISARLEEKGFVFLHWGHGGWVHLFSKKPIRTVEDLRLQKFFVWAGQDALVQWWKQRDFQPVALAATDIMTGLQTGMIDALPTTPLAGLGLQWFRQTPYMLDLPLGPLLGATLATSREWKKLSEEDRAAFLEAAKVAERQLEEEIPKQDREAVDQMEQRGLTVTAAEVEEWRAAAQEFATSMRGNIVPADAYERVTAVRDEYRRSMAAKDPVLKKFLEGFEDRLAATALVAVALLPLAEAASRKLFGTGIPGSGPFVQRLTLWVAFLGAALAAREGKLLALATGEFLPEGRWRRASGIVAGGIAAAASSLLCRASIDLLVIEREAGTTVALGLPEWVAQLALPLGFGLIAVRLVWRSSDLWWGRCLAGLGLVAGVLVGQYPLWIEGASIWPGLALVALATVLGGPIFAALGGVAVWLFLADGVPAAAVPVETYRLTVSPTLPAIPLFTLAGFLLAEGQASRRLLRVFRAWVGWFPGGTAVVAALTCAFFTVFTGGSGVTILALGGLLIQALREDRYRERFSLGLLTASGSLGLLFPPALPLILYGIVAQVAIQDLFVGGLLPGILLVGLVAAWGVREGLVSRVERRPFNLRKAVLAVWRAKWELLLPVVVLGSLFSGYATLVESAALTALYSFLVVCVIHRDLSIRGELVRVLVECMVLIGGVLIILAVAMGLTSYLVDAQVPARLLEWVQAYIHSPLVFLLCLNLLLLLVGCLMDIFSAIVVVVPLIVPLGLAFGIDPVHLGIIFVANLELGYLTPPVGLNLFLAAYRFERPLLQVWRAALPMLAILGIGVLLITYIPGMTLWLLDLVGRQ